MQSKVCLITGATSGIGKATAKGLAQQGATVVLVSRNCDKGEAVKQEIVAASGNAEVDVLAADLASQVSIRQLTDDFKARYDRLHVLINNAGVSLMQRSVTVDGIETTFAVNHLAPFLLTHLLLDVLKASAPARVVTVSSSGQRPIQFDDLQGAKQYAGLRAYAQSKTANIMFTYELARRVEGAGVTANVRQPGVVRTNLARDMSLPFQLMLQVMSPFMATPEKGAETVLYLASSPDVAEVSGKYFAKKREVRSSEFTYDADAARRLWEISAELTHLSTEVF